MATILPAVPQAPGLATPRQNDTILNIDIPGAVMKVRQFEQNVLLQQAQEQRLRQQMAFQEKRFNEYDLPMLQLRKDQMALDVKSEERKAVLDELTIQKEQLNMMQLQAAQAGKFFGQNVYTDEDRQALQQAADSAGVNDTSLFGLYSRGSNDQQVENAAIAINANGSKLNQNNAVVNNTIKNGLINRLRSFQANLDTNARSVLNDDLNELMNTPINGDTSAFDKFARLNESSYAQYDQSQYTAGARDLMAASELPADNLLRQKAEADIANTKSLTRQRDNPDGTTSTGELYGVNTGTFSQLNSNIKTKGDETFQFSDRALGLLQSLPSSVQNFTLTSGHRTKSENDAVNGVPGSAHLSGDAIDIRWDDQGKAFNEWLKGNEGKQWLSSNNYKKIVHDAGSGNHIHLAPAGKEPTASQVSKSQTSSSAGKTIEDLKNELNKGRGANVNAVVTPQQKNIFGTIANANGFNVDDYPAAIKNTMDAVSEVNSQRAKVEDLKALQQVGAITEEQQKELTSLEKTYPVLTPEAQTKELNDVYVQNVKKELLKTGDIRNTINAVSSVPANDTFELDLGSQGKVSVTKSDNGRFVVKGLSEYDSNPVTGISNPTIISGTQVMSAEQFAQLIQDSDVSDESLNTLIEKSGQGIDNAVKEQSAGITNQVNQAAQVLNQSIQNQNQAQAQAAQAAAQQADPAGIPGLLNRNLNKKIGE